MATDARTPESAKLPRVLGTRDIVLLTIVAVVALRWLSVAAQLGPAGLTLWLLGALLFEIPLGLAVLELSSRNPGEGGLYLWSREAFGERHGFIAAWTYWLANLISSPSSLLFAAGMFWYVGGERWMHHASNPGHNAAFCLAVLWGATLFNIRGLDPGQVAAQCGCHRDLAGGRAGDPGRRRGVVPVRSRHDILTAQPGA